MISIFAVQDVLAKTTWPGWFKPVIGGLGVGAIAILFPEVLGVGYEATDAALHGRLSLAILIALVAVKTAATALTLGSGFGGGIFSPSLYVGAMLGGAFGLVAAMAFPDYASHHTAYSIVGMAAVAGAVLGAPISTILIVFELTANFDLTIAVMIATAVASLITNHIIGRSFFRWQLERRGIDLTGGQVRYLMRDTPVRRILTVSPATLPADADRDAIRKALDHWPKGDFLVVDGEKLTGVLTLEDLRPLLFGNEEEAAQTAGELARTPPVLLLADDNLADAVDHMDQCDDDFIPVVNDREERHVVGIVKKRDLVHEHNRALIESSDESRGGTL
jgi:CIC family chloride channel protein